MTDTLSREQIECIYNILKNKTKVSDEVKEHHIKSIEEKYK